VQLVINTDHPGLYETLGIGSEAAHIDWQMYQPKYGNSVEISSAATSSPSQQHFTDNTGILEGFHRGAIGARPRRKPELDARVSKAGLAHCVLQRCRH
jgi:hypothetical protein